jgi:hypothetical protein
MTVPFGPALDFRGFRIRRRPIWRTRNTSRSRLQGVATLAAAVSLLSCTIPAAAQYVSSGGEPRHERHSVPRKKKPVSDEGTSWRGLSVDLAVVHPINSHVSITDGGTQVGQFNQTGIQLAVTTAYLFQEGRFLIGPRLKVAAGWVETMPLDYTIRTNGSLTFGGEAGYAAGRWYAYGFGTGGAAWVSAERAGGPRTNEMVPAYEVGVGFRYALSQRWYGKAEVAYTALGDYRLRPDYLDPKPFLALSAGFGFQFGPN